MTHKNDDQLMTVTRTLDRYASKHRLFPDYQYTFCCAPATNFPDDVHRENSKLVSLSRCASSDTPSKIKGQNQAALNLNKGDVIFNHREDNVIESFTFFDAAEEEDNITISNIDSLGRPVLHTRHACYLLALSYSLARDYTRNGYEYFSIYNIPDIVTNYLSTYLRLHELQANYVNEVNSNYTALNKVPNEPSVDLEIQYWDYLDMLPYALTFVRYAFYYYKCMIFNLQDSDYPSLNEYVYELWQQGSLAYPHEIYDPNSFKSQSSESDSMH
jgi:hypothetical protein